MSEPAIPDILSQRSGLSFRRGSRPHPDLKDRGGQPEIEPRKPVQENSELRSQGAGGDPDPRQRIFSSAGTRQVHAKQLDRLIALLDKEKDQFRVEILRTIYADGASHWQSMVLQPT